jgi:isopenicillin-N N-acyltransferase-like protein
MTTPPLPFPLIVLEGSPTERGIAYGRGCRDRVQATIDVYRRIFKTEGKLTWSRALDAAAGYAEPIERYDADIRAEIAGIAQGAAVPEKAILAINARSELLFQLTAGTAAPKPCCTALAALAPPDSDGAVLMAQNWDWYRATMDQCVLLLIRQPPRPTILQLVEAGLIAKMGLNSAGIGLCTNALLTDGWRVGVPYHAILRGILNARHMGDAIGAVTRARRASAGNYLIGHGDGFAVDIEASPDHLNLLYPQQGLLTHANHFQRSNPANADLMAGLWPDTVVRDVRAAQLCRAQRRGDDPTWIKRVLSDHFDHPSGICTHPGDAADPDAQWQTNASMIMDLGRRMMFLTHGPPCRNDYRPVDAGAMFDRDSSSPVEGELP